MSDKSVKEALSIIKSNLRDIKRIVDKAEKQGKIEPHIARAINTIVGTWVA